MPTAVSSVAPYCTIQEFLDRYDAALVAQLLSDDCLHLSPGQLAESPRLTELLEDASGWVESACLTAGKYEAVDLAALNGNSKKFLARIVADLAFGMLRQRRGGYEDQSLPQFTQALETLNRLRAGERVFALQENMNAGNPTSKLLTERDIERTNLMTFQAARFFGIRANRNRP